MMDTIVDATLNCTTTNWIACNPVLMIFHAVPLPPEIAHARFNILRVQRTGGFDFLQGGIDRLETTHPEVIQPFGHPICPFVLVGLYIIVM
jgi:hypothetical protein